MTALTEIPASVLAFGDNRLPERFWDKVCVSEGGCWIWAAQTSQTGYGRFWAEGRMVKAHRLRRPDG